MIELIKNNVVLQVAVVIWFGCLMYFISDIIWEKRLKEDKNEGVIHREFNLEELYYQPKVIHSFSPKARRLRVIRRPNYQARRLRMSRGRRS